MTMLPNTPKVTATFDPPSASMNPRKQPPEWEDVWTYDCQDKWGRRYVAKANGDIVTPLKPWSQQLGLLASNIGLAVAMLIVAACMGVLVGITIAIALH